MIRDQATTIALDWKFFVAIIVVGDIEAAADPKWISSIQIWFQMNCRSMMKNVNDKK